MAAAVIQGGAVAAAAAYVVYDILTGPKPVGDEDLVVVVPSLVFGNRVRWCGEEGCLYITDPWGKAVWRQRIGGTGGEPQGLPELVLRVASDGPEPISLLRGADGSLLVCLSGAKHIVSVGPGHPPEQEAPVVADLSGVEQGPLMDLAFDGAGGVYCSSLATQILHAPLASGRSLTSSIMSGATEAPAGAEGGGPRAVAAGLFLPLGIALTADGRTLLCTQLHTFHIWAWDRDPATGRLSNYRIWAEMPGAMCHGLCLDAEGCAWVAVVGSRTDAWAWSCLAGGPASQLYQRRMGIWGGGFVRVREGGKILQRVMFRGLVGIGCDLGGPDGHTLYMSVARDAEPERKATLQPGNSFVAALRVAVGAPASGVSAGAAPPQSRL